MYTPSRLMFGVHQAINVRGDTSIQPTRYWLLCMHNKGMVWFDTIKNLIANQDNYSENVSYNCICKSHLNNPLKIWGWGRGNFRKQQLEMSMIEAVGFFLLLLLLLFFIIISIWWMIGCFASARSYNLSISTPSKTIKPKENCIHWTLVQTCELFIQCIVAVTSFQLSSI